MNNERFIDYHKMEEDGNNSDLESHLYASIYYTSVDEKTDNRKEVYDVLDDATTCIYPSNFKSTNQVSNILHKCKSAERSNMNQFYEDRREEDAKFDKIHNTNKNIGVNNIGKNNDSMNKFSRSNIQVIATNGRHNQNMESINYTQSRELPQKMSASKDSINIHTKNIKNNYIDIKLSNTGENMSGSRFINKNIQDTKRANVNYRPVFNKNIITSQSQSVNQDTSEKYEVEEISSKYNIVTLPRKDANCVISEDDTDSDESILEVPIPPKPQPPVINLNDSEEECRLISSDEDIVIQESCSIREKKQVYDNVKSITSSTNPISHDTNNYEKDNIILNCTEVQKSASSIKEIKEMSKIMENRKKKKSKNKQSNKTKNKNIKSINIDTSEEHDLSRLVTSSKQRVSQSYANSINIIEGDVDFTEDIQIPESFEISQSNINRNEKRLLEHQHEDTGKHKRAKYNDNNSQHKEINVTKVHQKYQEWSQNNQLCYMEENQCNVFDDINEQENFDVAEIQSKMSKDPRLWAILNEDLMPDVSRRDRFWKQRCTRCRQSGHLIRNCPEPRRPPTCHMCGIEGHTENQCPEKMCLTCGKKQGTFRKTCETCRTLHCTMCNAVGHKSTKCPDLWRRYHQTTKTDNVCIPTDASEVMKPANLLSCCNCGRRGHEASTCTDYRWSQHFPTPAFVSNYRDIPGYVESHTKEKSRSMVYQGLKCVKVTNKVFSPDIVEDETNIAQVIYLYGYYYTTKPSGQEMRYDISNDRSIKIGGLLEGRIQPHFLNDMFKLFTFQIKIYREKSQDADIVIMSVRTCETISENFSTLLLHWLRLDDHEKDYALCTNLPQNRQQLINHLNSKLNEVGKDATDPRVYHSEIMELKKKLSTIPEVDINTRERLQKVQVKFIMILRRHSRFGNYVQKLYALIKLLRKGREVNVTLNRYLKAVILYSKIFMPHTSTDTKGFLAYLQRKEQNKIRKKKKAARKVSQQSDFDNAVICNNISVQEEVPLATSKKSKTNKYQLNCQSNLHNNISDNKTTLNSVSILRRSNNGSKSSDIEHQYQDLFIQINVDNSNIQTVIENQENNIKELESIKKETTTKNTRECEILTVNSESLKTGNIHENIPRASQSATSVNLKPGSNVIDTINNQQRNTDRNVRIEEKLSNIVEEQPIEVTSNAKQENYERSENTKDNQLNVNKHQKNSNKKAQKKQKLTEKKKNNINMQAAYDEKLINKAVTAISDAKACNVPFLSKAAKKIEKKLYGRTLKSEDIKMLRKMINLEMVHKKRMTSICSRLDINKTKKKMSFVP